MINLFFYATLKKCVKKTNYAKYLKLIYGNWLPFMKLTKYFRKYTTIISNWSSRNRADFTKYRYLVTPHNFIMEYSKCLLIITIILTRVQI